MNINNEGAAIARRPVLALSGTKAALFQFLLVGAAVVLPLAGHLTGAPVRVLVPMHWPVLLAGLVYGWRGGLLTGAVSPGLSFMLCGLPSAVMIPAMTAELAIYGFLAGLLRERFRLNPAASVAVALVVGRTASVLILFLTGGTHGAAFMVFSKSTLTPGLAAAACQVIILPFVAGWWVRKGSN
jgi:niacin transporter